MMRLRLFCGTLIISMLLTNGLVLADEPDTSAADQLKAAIKQFDAHDYDAAYQTLRGIDEDGLSDEDMQLQYQRYISLAREAVTKMGEAREDFRAGTAALTADKPQKARKLLGRVTANKYAPADLKTKAAKHISDIDAKQKAAAAPASQTQAPRARKASGKSSLLDQLSREHALLWQKAVAGYRDAESKIRKAVLAEDFAEAHRLMDLAKQTIEMNRRYADPASLYEDMQGQAVGLEQFIDDQERDYDEDMIIAEQQEIELREVERVERAKNTKARQVNQLMDQAIELRKEQRLDDAVEILKQVLTIDPMNSKAAWMKETLEDLSVAMRDITAVKHRHEEAQDLFVENDEAGIPWHEDIRYPKNWLEIIAKRTDTTEAAEPEINRLASRKLKAIAPELNFDMQPFEEVIDQIRALTGLNIVPNWAALDAMAIEKDAEVTLKLKNVKYEKALQLILDEVGAGEVELAYQIDEGVIEISTKEDLSRKTVTRVYNVQDLIISVPTFRGRQVNVDQIGQNTEDGGLGGGSFLDGGSGGGGGGGQGGMFEGGGGNTDDDDTGQGDPIEPIIELIQQTIEPDSWREAGGMTGSIQSLNQQLIITQTNSAHSELRDLLRQLRQSRALQVAVEARYITISRNWLEQIGVDLDIVLNNGNAGYDRSTILNPATQNPVLVPRQFTRNGYTPGAPTGVGVSLPTQPFGQPYGQPGLVPATGSGPSWGSMTPVPLVNNTMNLAAPSNTNVAGTLGSIANTTPAFQIFGSFLDGIQVDFLLRATQIDRRSSDLDAPRLVLFNGQRATFESFIEQDYIAALTPIVGDNAGAFEPGIQTALTGRSLDVQATVSADRRYVTMTIRTFIRLTGGFRTVFFGGSSTVGSGFVELATQTTQQIRTTVSVPDGGTLLIGGLKLSGERDVDAGVPILSRIPILKRAFSNTSNVKDDQILLILIKPTIIIQEEAEAEAFPRLSAVSTR